MLNELKCEICKRKIGCGEFCATCEREGLVEQKFDEFHRIYLVKVEGKNE